MLKKALTIIIIALHSTTFSQIKDLNNFKYIYLSNEGFYKEDIEDIFKDFFSDNNFLLINDLQLRRLDAADIDHVLFAKIAIVKSNDKYFLSISLNDFLKNIVFKQQEEQKISDWGETTTIKQALKKIQLEHTAIIPSVKKTTVMETLFNDWRKVDLDEKEFKKYLDYSISNLNPIEGIWTNIDNNQYRIGIIKDEANDYRDFVAFIINSENPLWEPKDVKIEFLKTAFNTVYTTSYYLLDFTKIGATSSLKGNGILEIELTKSTDENALIRFIKNYPMLEDVKGKEITVASEGSGFLISRNGSFITNWHVIKGSSLIKIILPVSNKEFEGSLLLKDETNDIAVIQLKNFNFDQVFTYPIPFSINNNVPTQAGQAVFTIGFPLGEMLGNDSKVSDGIINSIYGFENDPRLLQISNSIQPGNSGSPLFSKSGDFLGIVISSLNAKYFYENYNILPQNVNYAIKQSYLYNLVSLFQDADEIINRKNLLGGLTFEDMIGKVKPFVGLVKVYK